MERARWLVVSYILYQSFSDVILYLIVSLAHTSYLETTLVYRANHQGLAYTCYRPIQDSLIPTISDRVKKLVHKHFHGFDKGLLEQRVTSKCISQLSIAF